MKSLFRHLDITVAVISCLLLITVWASRGVVMAIPYTPSSTDIGSVSQMNITGFHNAEISDTGEPFRWGRQQVKMMLNLNYLTLIQKNASVVSFRGTTVTTQPVTVALDDRLTPPIVVQGGMFRQYHVLLNHSGIHQSQALLSVTTTSVEVIKKQELGIALGKITVAPLTAFFAVEPMYYVNYFVIILGTVFLAIGLVVAIGRVVMVPNQTTTGIRTASIVVMVILMYTTAETSLSVLSGVIIILGALCVRPALLGVSSPTLNAMFTKWPVLIVYIVFISVAITSLLVDKKRDICALNPYIKCINYDYNFATGDEPIYIKVAKSLRYAGTAKVTDGPTNELAHSIHSLGVSFLLMPTVVEEDMLWPRISFIMLNGVIVSMLFHLSGNLRIPNASPLTILQRIGITTSAMIALPLIPAANQFYPDLIAGVLLMGIWYWAYRMTNNLPTAPLPYILAVILLPWLHSKYLYISVVPMLIIGFIMWRHNARTLLTTVILAYLLSLAGVMWYGLTAWGNMFGPISKGSVQLTAEGLSRIFGLHFDQNQGVFGQHPLLFAGVLGLGIFYRRNPLLFVMWAWCVAVPIVLNALHSNPYGGFSYSGRFHWSSAVMLFVPTIGMLVWMVSRLPVLTTRILLGSLMLQSYFWYMYSTQTVLYPRSLKDGSLVTERYAILYGPLEALLPQYRSLEVALTTPANYIWLIVMLIAACMVNYRQRHERMTMTT